MKYVKQWMAVCVSVLLLWTTLPQDTKGFGVPPAGRAAQEVYAPVPPNDMDALVAPIALYPDALVAQILGAATNPDQVEAADTFVKSNYNLSGDALVQAAENQEWDPSVMALLQFPSVLDKLAQNLGWTSALGDVSANQQSDVMAAIQRMRAKAYAAGNLTSGEQIKVVKEIPDIIVIQPANPQVVYVPAYNPTAIYGAPVATPGYSSGDVAATAMITFGLGIAVGAMVNSSNCGWGYYGWRMNWAGRAVYCGGGPYYGNPYWWGGYYPGFRPGYRPPYYPPPRPPRPPPPGWRPPYPPGSRPPYRPPGGRPPVVQPLPGKPGGGRPPTGGKPPSGGRHGNGEANATAATGEAGRTVDSAGETWRAEHVARETGGATEADDASGNADAAKRSAKYTRTAWIPARAKRETRSAAKCIFRDHRRAAGKRERQPQLESARETTKRTRASPKSSTAGAGRRKKAVIKERAERLAVLEKERQ